MNKITQNMSLYLTMIHDRENRKVIETHGVAVVHRNLLRRFVRRSGPETVVVLGNTVCPYFCEGQITIDVILHGNPPLTTCQANCDDKQVEMRCVLLLMVS